MAESLWRELVLPAVRVSVPDRPNERALAAIAKRVPDLWTTSPRDLATQQVVRLVVAEILSARLTSTELPTSADELTLGQAAHLFGPHVMPHRQAQQIAFVEAVNARVPAAVDPLREALRKVGITGREPIRIIMLGLDRLPERAASTFWSKVKSAPAVTAMVDLLTGDATDVSGLDRRVLAHADAVVLAGGTARAITIGAAPERKEKGWLEVPLGVVRRTPQPDQTPVWRRTGVELGLRAPGWWEVFEPALDALGVAMHQLDLGQRPRGHVSPLADTLAARLVAAKARPAIEVVNSLRAVDPVVRDLFGEAITTSPVRVAVAVPEDEMFAQLWTSRTALDGPLLVGDSDLFFGGSTDVWVPGQRPAGRPKQAGPKQPRPKPGTEPKTGRKRPPRRRGKPDATP